ncbi:1-acyl-sn-glycerol-3-phosphate acyltransferase beta-like [Ornithodoros turicata]|uniref:1-acyl-sn-glycerol-3-phosphate acyltransferase beta-like n=1 Tax=Ornithodoros turicata TaxID=34597 RepID=UPI00313A3656
MFAILVCILAILCPILYTRYKPSRYYVKIGLYYFILTMVSIFSIGPSLLHYKDPRNFMYASNMLRRISSVFGITFKVINPDRIRKNQRYVFVANHQTSLDVLGMLLHWHLFNPCVPVIKKELLWTGPVGIFCWLCGSVFVDRQNSDIGRAALYDKLELVSHGKCSLFIYAEGTRNQSTKMLKFKKGAFFMAVQCKVPVLPIVYSQYSRFLDVSKKIYTDGKITMTILPEVSTEGLTEADAPALSEKVHDIMQDCIDDEIGDMMIWGESFNTVNTFRETDFDAGPSAAEAVQIQAALDAMMNESAQEKPVESTSDKKGSAPPTVHPAKSETGKGAEETAPKDTTTAKQSEKPAATAKQSEKPAATAKQSEKPAATDSAIHAAAPPGSSAPTKAKSPTDAQSAVAAATEPHKAKSPTHHAAGAKSSGSSHSKESAHEKHSGHSVHSTESKSSTEDKTTKSSAPVTSPSNAAKSSSASSAHQKKSS